MTLETGHRIHGRVALGTGRFAAGVRVFYNHGEHGELTGGSVQTGPDGRFEIDSLPKGCTFTVYSPKGYAPFKDQPLPLDTEAEVPVGLEAASIVRGRVVDAVIRKPVIPYRIRIMISDNRLPGEPAPVCFRNSSKRVSSSPRATESSNSTTSPAARRYD